MSAARLGRRMAYIAYSGSGGRALSLFESPDPIAQPPGATPAPHGLLVLQLGTGTGPVTGVWLHLPGTYVEVMGAGISSGETERLSRGLSLAATP